MFSDKDQPFSAQVVLKPGTGKVIDSATQITAENIKEYTPSPVAVAEVSQFFTDAGLETGGLVGISFSITGSVKTFENLFKIHLDEKNLARMQVTRGGKVISYELPLSALPASIAQLIIAVTFTPPPDFGPAEFV